MNAVTLYFTPQELAHVRGVDILQIFKEIKNHTLPAIMTDKGLRIPITSSRLTRDTTCLSLN